MYVFVLDEKGIRRTSYVVGVHADTLEETERLARETYPNANIVTGNSEMQSQFISGKAYLNGEWLDPIVVEVSAEEIQAKEAEQVASEYEAKFKALDDEIIRAEVIDKDTEYADELRQQREALQLEFMEKRGEL